MILYESGTTAYICVCFITADCVYILYYYGYQSQYVGK